MPYILGWCFTMTKFGEYLLGFLFLLQFSMFISLNLGWDFLSGPGCLPRPCIELNSSVGTLACESLSDSIQLGHFLSYFLLSSSLCFALYSCVV